ncbi:MAG: XRE family transcriptional regulator, partial [Chryseobacterium cucumeris]
LQEVWQTKLANPKITFASYSAGWICQISDRNFTQAFGASRTFKHLVKEVFDAGKSRHFQTFKMSPEAIEAGKQIKAVREKYAVKQNELARAMGKGQATVSEWESGLINISQSLLRDIESACQRIAGVYERE